MVFTLQRYVFRELLRVFLLATIALTLVVSLGGILRPAQEYGIAPKQVVHLLSYFIPISLTFVLPVAALFAAALTYGRFASDNELDACRASGISMLLLIYPGFVLALLVAIANLLLSFHIVPYFVHQAERSLKADAKQILFHNLQRRGYYDMTLGESQRYFIYADYADAPSDTLFGIIVMDCEGGQIRRVVTSESTRVQFNTRDNLTEVQLGVEKARQIGDLTENLWWEVGSLTLRRQFGSLIEDEIKFKKIEEMKAIEANLMRFEPVAKAARQAHQQLLTELLAEDIGKTVHIPGGFYELRAGSRIIRISARGCTLTQRLMVGLQGPLIVDEYDARTGRLVRRVQTDKNAVLGIEEDVRPARWVLEISDAQVEGTGQLMLHDAIGDLQLPASLTDRLGAEGPLSLAQPERAAALLGAAPSSILAGLHKTLVREITNARTHIRSEIHSRLIFGIGCLPMILIGIGWGALRREGHLLGAFGASCIPASILGIAIISGKQVAEGVETMVLPGILIMYSGLAFLLLLTVFVYHRLLRH